MADLYEPEYPLERDFDSDSVPIFKGKGIFIANHKRFMIANAMVATLPQSKANSLIRRPIVPIVSMIKALGFMTSLMNISL